MYEFGNRKFLQINKIIDNSKHTRNLFSQCYTKRAVPTAVDLRQCILSNFRLSFTKKDIELMAMTILLKKFNDEVNIDNFLITDEGIVDIYLKFENTFTY